MGWTKNGDYTEMVTVEYDDTSNITGITFLQNDADQSLFKAPLTAEVESAGAYRLDLNDLAITGEGTVTVDVGVVVDGVLVPLASKAVTADDASVSFNVTADMASNPVGFAIRQGAGAQTSLSGASLSYLRRLDASEDNADVAAAFEVATAIAKLPAAVTLDDEAAVTAANGAYGNLTEAQQALVANAGVLQAAVGRIAELKEGKEAADAVIAAVAALPEVDALTLDNETAVNDAKAAYDKLSDVVKTLVDEATVTKLNAAVEKIAALKADKEAADAVIAMINALPETITEENRQAVEAARDAYDELTDAQKALVGQDVLAKLEAAEAALDGGDITYGDVNDDGKVDAADALQCLQHSVELIKLEGDAFTAANVDLDEDVDASDALYILQFSVELIDSLPVEQ